MLCNCLKTLFSSLFKAQNISFVHLSSSIGTKSYFKICQGLRSISSLDVCKILDLLQDQEIQNVDHIYLKAPAGGFRDDRNSLIVMIREKE